jgi:hypothetical protein
VEGVQIFSFVYRVSAKRHCPCLAPSFPSNPARESWELCELWQQSTSHLICTLQASDPEDLDSAPHFFINPPLYYTVNTPSYLIVSPTPDPTDPLPARGTRTRGNAHALSHLPAPPIARHTAHTTPAHLHPCAPPPRRALPLPRNPAPASKTPTYPYPRSSTIASIDWKRARRLRHSPP